jgi:rhamnogalacturonan endolyase
MRRAVIAVLLSAALVSGADFVRIRGGTLPGRPEVRVEDFEMAVHPVTNRQYLEFVEEAGHPPPLHWRGGRIPPGMEDWPVVFVNRFDAAAYCRWRTKREGRLYRLPTAAEFEYAARAGSAEAVYPWGSEAPAGKANYDAEGNRNFADWQRHLRAVKEGARNSWGLYDMAGNVWQMVDRYPDLATSRFIYRVADPIERETALAGGSWARGEYYLRCGVFGGASSGIRHPDIGFRLVREPEGTTHFRRQVRRLVAAPAQDGAVFLGWQLLASDSAEVGFHVYRSTRTDAAGHRITSRPVQGPTNFIDRNPPPGSRLYYRVRPVDRNGAELPPSEWAGIEPGGKPSGLLMSISATTRQGGVAPVFGDLDGDGLLDVVLRLDNGIQEMSRDPGVPVELEAFTSYGRPLWRRALVRHEHCFGNANNVPVNVYDLDGDGRAEVIAQIEEGGELFLAVLEGLSGRLLRKTPWTRMVSDFSKSSTRVHMSIAYLDGKRPAIVTQTGLYENEVIEAFDARLARLWRYESFAETNGSGSHHVDIADVDGDGRDEVFNGTMLLNPDGRLRWALYRGHPDIVAVARILPATKTRQVYYVVESSIHAGAYLVDASSGQVLWKVNREDDPRWVHGHTGWASDIWEGSPGLELLANRDGHPMQDNVLFSAEGKILVNPFPRLWRPVNWTGAPTRELMSGDGRRLGRFNGSTVEPLPLPPPNEAGSGSCPMTADLAGDYRDEVICLGRTPEGAPALFVYTNTEQAPRREPTRTASREYRLWLARNIGGGYASYYEWQP